MNTFGTALLYAVPLFRQGQPDVSEHDMEKTIMMLKQLCCPSCGAGIEIDAKGRNTIFCPYCGSQISIDNGSKTITHNININTQYTNAAAIQREQRKDRQNEFRYKQSKLLAFMAMFMTLMIFLILLVLNKEEEKAIEEGKIQVGISATTINSEETKYQSVVKQLEATGFTNITTIDLNDADSFSNKEDTIENITINGNRAFSSFDYYDSDAKIVITYH